MLKLDPTTALFYFFESRRNFWMRWAPSGVTTSIFVALGLFLLLSGHNEIDKLMGSLFLATGGLGAAVFLVVCYQRRWPTLAVWSDLIVTPQCKVRVADAVAIEWDGPDTMGVRLQSGVVRTVYLAVPADQKAAAQEAMRSIIQGEKRDAV